MTAFTLLDRATARQYITRNWMARITGNQWKVVCHVFDRTIEWGRPDCYISVDEFANGADPYTNGTGVGRSTLIVILDQLVKLGMLQKVGRGGRMTNYSLNLMWGLGTPTHEPQTRPQSEDASQMPLPPSKRQHAQATSPAMPARKVKNSPGTRPASGLVTPPTRPTSGPPIGGKEEDIQEGKKYRTASGIRENTRQGLDKVLEVARRAADQREAKRAAREARHLRVGDVMSRWDDALREHAPDAVRLTWPAKTRGQVKLAIRQETFAKIDHKAFVTHVVKHWTLIGKTALHWMDGYPPEPSALFMASRLSYFVQAFLDRETHLADLNALGIEGLKAKYRRGGMDREAADQAAKAQVDARGAVSREEAEALKDQLARSEEARRKQERAFKDRLKATARANAADDAVARADRMRRFDQDEAE